MQIGKVFALSKTVGVALVWAALAAFSTPVQAWIAKHPGWHGFAVALVFILLRRFTFGPMRFLP